MIYIYINILQAVPAEILFSASFLSYWAVMLLTIPAVGLAIAHTLVKQETAKLVMQTMVSLYTILT